MLNLQRVMVLAAGTAVGCGAVPQPRQLDSGTKLALGRQIYDLHCRGCHGTTGDGQGPAAIFLYPRPRDLIHEKFRIRSTATGTPPSNADLRRVLTAGLPGTAMPGFAFLVPDELDAVAVYVKSLSPGVFEAKRPPIPIELGSPPPFTAATITAGKVLYKRLGCNTCHGEQGRGDGELADDLLDARDLPIRCRDLVNDAFKGGTTIRDIYLRLSGGMDGTPMAGVADSATIQERWELATYVAALRRGAAIDGTDDRHGERMIVSRLARGRVPSTEPLAAEWDQAPASIVALFPLATHASHRTQLAPVSVRSLHDQWTIAFRLEWTDTTLDDRSDGTERFADAAALQFTVGSREVFLGMGAQQAPVRIWHWKADWQREFNERIVSARTATTTMSSPPLPAEQAENPYVLFGRSRSVEEGLAAGAGTFTARSLQRTSGIGIWKENKWYVVLARDLDGADVSTNTNVKLAVAIWDGANRDRGAQKAISSWYRVEASE